MTEHPEMDGLTVRERFVRIDQMLADIDRIFADRDRKRQEIRFAPWLAVTTGMGTGAALFAAAFTLFKLFG
jgi:hypothetical protein